MKKDKSIKYLIRQNTKTVQKLRALIISRNTTCRTQRELKSIL